MRFSPRFTIGQLMLVVLLAGLALAPVSLYRRNAGTEFIVVMVAFETIGLPTIAILCLLALMAPGPQRTRYILILSAAPTLLIFGAFALVEVSAFVIGFGLVIKEALYGNTRVRLQAVYILITVMMCTYSYLPPRCPSCHRFRLLGKRAPEPGSRWRSIESLECRACGGHARRTWHWIVPGPLRPEPRSPAVSDVHYLETHDS